LQESFTIQLHRSTQLHAAQPHRNHLEDTVISPFRDDLLAGKNAFITGGTSGINLAIAQRLAKAGASVAVLGRKADKAEAAAKTLGPKAKWFSADVRDYEQLDKALREVAAAWGPIDILVNGAAGNFPAPAVGMSANGFKAVIDIDVLGTFNACRAAYEHLRKPGASVISISATQAFIPAPMQAHVCAAKAGVDMLTRVLAMEWGPSGVRVNSIAPGPVDGTEGMSRLAPDAEMRKRVEGMVPLGRFASKEEIAEVALFLCSPAAAYVTGSVLVADGGQSLNGYGSMFAGIGG
jgi:NAD(P)-dependent dehydrogenase (short-subunit alcohol dehydrogenase family)